MEESSWAAARVSRAWGRNYVLRPYFPIKATLLMSRLPPPSWRPWNCLKGIPQFGAMYIVNVVCPPKRNIMTLKLVKYSGGGSAVRSLSLKPRPLRTQLICFGDYWVLYDLLFKGISVIGVLMIQLSRKVGKTNPTFPTNPQDEI